MSSNSDPPFSPNVPPPPILVHNVLEFSDQTRVPPDISVPPPNLCVRPPSLGPPTVRNPQLPPDSSLPPDLSLPPPSIPYAVNTKVPPPACSNVPRSNLLTETMQTMNMQPPLSLASLPPPLITVPPPLRTVPPPLATLPPSLARVPPPVATVPPPVATIPPPVATLPYPLAARAHPPALTSMLPPQMLSQNTHYYSGNQTAPAIISTQPPLYRQPPKDFFPFDRNLPLQNVPRPNFNVSPLYSNLVIDSSRPPPVHLKAPNMSVPPPKIDDIHRIMPPPPTYRVPDSRSSNITSQLSSTRDERYYREEYNTGQMYREEQQQCHYSKSDLEIIKQDSSYRKMKAEYDDRIYMKNALNEKLLRCNERIESHHRGSDEQGYSHGDRDESRHSRRKSNERSESKERNDENRKRYKEHYQYRESERKQSRTRERDERRRSTNERSHSRESSRHRRRSSSRQRKELSDRDIILNKFRNNYCTNSEEVMRRIQDESQLDAEETSKWYRSSPAELYYSPTDRVEVVKQTPRLKKLCEKFKESLIERGRKARPEVDELPPLEAQKPRLCEKLHNKDDSSTEDSDDEVGLDDERLKLAADRVMMELQRKQSHPRRLHPELWYNNSGEMNGGPLCRCNSRARRLGMRHGVFASEPNFPLCDPQSNNIEKLYHYRLTVSPATNFLIRTPTIITHDEHEFLFSGFSMFSHHKLCDIPECKVIRFNIEYTIMFVEEPAPRNFTIQELQLFEEFVFTEILELVDLDLGKATEDKCSQFHFLPRFVRSLQDGGSEILSMCEVLKYLIEENVLLIPPERLMEIHKMDHCSWQHFIDKFKGMIVTCPGKKPCSIRVDQLDRSPPDPIQDPSISKLSSGASCTTDAHSECNTLNSVNTKSNNEVALNEKVHEFAMSDNAIGEKSKKTCERSETDSVEVNEQHESAYDEEEIITIVNENKGEEIISLNDNNAIKLGGGSISDHKGAIPKESRSYSQNEYKSERGCTKGQYSDKNNSSSTRLESDNRESSRDRYGYEYTSSERGGSSDSGGRYHGHESSSSERYTIRDSSRSYPSSESRSGGSNRFRDSGGRYHPGHELNRDSGGRYSRYESRSSERDRKVDYSYRYPDTKSRSTQRDRKSDFSSRYHSYESSSTERDRVRDSRGRYPSPESIYKETDQKGNSSGKYPGYERDSREKESKKFEDKKNYNYFPEIVHFGIRPPQLSYAGNQEYQQAWRYYVKKRHLVANHSKPTRKDKQDLRDIEEKLQQMRTQTKMKRGVTIAVSSEGFYATGLMCDIVQHAMLIPVLVRHLRFHKSLEGLEEQIKYKFQSRLLLQKALTHPSFRENYGTNPDHAKNSLTNCGIRQPEYGSRKIHYTNTRKKGINILIEIMSRFGEKNEKESAINHNERLEFLGDAVVEFLTSIHLFRMFPKLAEGGLATFRAAIVQNQHLAVLAKNISLEKYMLFAHGSDLCREVVMRHAMANCFEALMGAVFLDGGLTAADNVFALVLWINDEIGLQVWKKKRLHELQEEEPLGDRHFIPQYEFLQKLTKFEESTGIKFKHIRLLARAFTDRSVGYTHLTLGSNQRLEFLGDTVLQLVVSAHLYKHFPYHHEGHLSVLRSSLVNNNTQATICDDLGMSEYALYSYPKAKPTTKKHKADLLESFLGAFYIDKGLEYFQAFCNMVLFPRLEEFIMNQNWNDPKSKLQQCCLTIRSMKGGEPDIPVYKVIESLGPTNTRVYTVAVYFRGVRLATGQGHSIQKAEMKAAEEALETEHDLFPQLDYQKRIVSKGNKSRRNKKSEHDKKKGPSNREEPKPSTSSAQDNIPRAYRMDDDNWMGDSSDEENIISEDYKELRKTPLDSDDDMSEDGIEVVEKSVTEVEEEQVDEESN